MEKTKNINIAIPLDLHTFFKTYAAKNGTTMKKLMIDFIEKLKEEEAQK